MDLAWADPGPVKGVTAQIHTLTLVTPGDFNLDGDVDAQDYAVWRSAYGLHGFSDADGNRDGSVDTADYVTWRDKVDALGAPGQAAVPEPGAAWLVLVGLGAALHIRRSRRRKSRDSGQS